MTLSDSIGKQIGPYEIIRLVARGRSAEVFEARHKLLNRLVALKVMPFPLNVADTQWRRFEREARAVASITHPNIVRVYDFGQEDSVWFVAMEFLDGETLESRLTRQRFSSRESVEIVSQLAEALRAAHENKIVHRDLKPANIMMTQGGSLKIMDFGLAKTLENEALTLEGEILGTPSYMAPEQTGLRPGVSVDARADLFSLGVVWAEMLSGKKVFSSGHLMKTLQQVAFGEPLLEIRDPALSSMIRKCLEKDPAHRYASAAELLRDLGQYLAGSFVPVKHSKPGFKKNILTGRKAWLLLILAGTLLSLSGPTLYFQERRSEKREWILQGEDSFDRENLGSSWTPDPPEREEFRDKKWGIPPWKLNQKHLEIRALDSTSLRWLRPVGGDLRLEFDVTTSSSYVPELTVNLRKQTSVGGYAFRLSPSKTRPSALLKMPEGVLLCVNPDFLLESSSRYHVDLARTRNHFTVTVNGKRVLEAEDFSPSLAHGQEWLEFEASRGFAEVDNVRCFKLSTPLKSDPLLTAEKWVARGMLREAEEEYADLAAQYAASGLGFEANFQRGILLEKLRRFREAKALFQSLENACPDENSRARVFFHLSVCLSQLGQEEAGEKVFLETLRRLSPGNTDGNTDRNIEWFGNGIGLGVSKAFALTESFGEPSGPLRARRLAQLQDILLFLARHFPQYGYFFSGPFTEYGRRLSKIIPAVEFEVFRKHFEKTLPEERASIAILNVFEGESYARGGDLGRATEAFKRTLTRFPDCRRACAESHLALGHLALSEGLFEEAKSEYRTVMQAFTGNLDVFGLSWIFLGETFRLSGNPEKAEALWQELHFDPRFQSFSEMALAVTILTLPDLDRLRPLMAWEEVSRSPLCQYFLGIRFVGEQKPDEAASFFRQCLKISRGDFFPALLAEKNLNDPEKKDSQP